VQLDNIVCIKGMIKLALFDGRGAVGDAAAPGFEPSATTGQLWEVFLGEHNPLLVRVPAGVWHGWKCVSPDEAYIVNAPTEVYAYDAPDQRELPHDTPAIPYDWGVRLR
jgi:dTDP-4-dehydrorhamnose 3,5-epimerase